MAPCMVRGYLLANIIAWGGNDYGQLGIGTGAAGERISTATKSAGVALNVKSMKKVEAGIWAAFALAADGTLYSWG